MLFALFNYHLERASAMAFGPFWFRKALKDYNFLLCVIFVRRWLSQPATDRSVHGLCAHVRARLLMRD